MYNEILVGNCNFFLPLAFNAPVRGVPQKTRIMGLPGNEDSLNKKVGVPLSPPLPLPSPPCPSLPPLPCPPLTSLRSRPHIVARGLGERWLPSHNMGPTSKGGEGGQGRGGREGQRGEESGRGGERGTFPLFCYAPASCQLPPIRMFGIPIGQN